MEISKVQHITHLASVRDPSGMGGALMAAAELDFLRAEARLKASPGVGLLLYFTLHERPLHRGRANMWILPLVGYLGAILGFCFLTLAIGISIEISHIQSPPLPTVSDYTDIDRDYSKRPLLSFRVGRGTHCARKKNPYPPYIWHYHHPNPPHSDRSLPCFHLAPEHCEPCRVHGQSTTFPNREID